MATPSQEELRQINQFTQREFTADELYVFDNLMIDTLPVESHFIIPQEDLVESLHAQTIGTPLILDHNSRTLPVGRSFASRMQLDDVNGKQVKTAYGKFYIDKGRATESNMTTDDLIKGIEAGTLSDTSIGFSFSDAKCSICGNDLRDFENCKHWPGRTYDVEQEDGSVEQETCWIEAGGEGTLYENSLVYAGAVNRATVQRSFSAQSVTENEKGTNLFAVEDIKAIPQGAHFILHFSKRGSALFTASPERVEYGQSTPKRSDDEVDMQKIREALSAIGITAEFSTYEELSAAITKFAEGLVNPEDVVAKADFEARVAEIAELSTKNTELAKQVEESAEALASRDATIAELTAKNEELAGKADLADTYRSDLVTKALEAGVRAQGNAFQSEMFGKFLETLSVSELKDVIAGFEAEFAGRFEGAKMTDGKETFRTNSSAPTSRDDFETDEEFREFVAEEAIKLANEQGIAFRDAMNHVVAKYSTDGSEE